MSPKNSALTVVQHELRYGSVAHVPLHLSHDWSTAVSLAIGASHHGRCPCRIKGSDFELFADLGRVREDFNAYCVVVAAVPLAQGRVQAGTLLYTGVVACEFATSATAYRQILREYLHAAATAVQGLMFSAFGPIPRELPWACGYLSPETSRLDSQERDAVLTAARVAAVDLARRGMTAREVAAKEGRIANVDVQEYPELA